MLRGKILQRGVLQDALKIVKSDTDSVTNRLQLPHRFDLHHKLGTREFTMYAEVFEATVLVHCSVSNHRLRPLGGGKNSAGTFGTRRKAKTRRQNCPPDDLPVEFSAFVAVPPSGLTLEALCSCSLGFLVVDGILFHRGLMPESVIPQDGNLVREGVYQGPLLNQRLLAECVVSTRGCINPLEPHRQHQAFFFDRHVNLWSSRFSRLGHLPVHTAKPEFADTLCHFLGCFGVNDELARFVEEFAHQVHKEEKSHWFNILGGLTGDR
uniref:Uncharacterized protein n=1 Tax=Trypanosoma congolense (strain IL3000) TaxID=1068625 RepID=G0UVI0_TRYCI|nr:conserved hypothetical protein [Trypanosoma congolense IL3000]